ncbi:ABC transporter substrate-binding protein [Clostridium beijerinckii]|jgi:ABC-type nitrate/sulfonate/bicarbonate transport systems, periplasmic components|uniref:ABC transporter substrate-binding protein n=3 Tax=Clostridium beijerinckii TaxID=1520 RepID=A0AAE2RW43_CLOBE|nr:ABC transporter substrate-binding protein [Clostridium beijerinckii]ABR34258.1 NMT1/THI5-like protein [Clostridium beijerinckii NCIMB 8052]AIU02928.1 NMT1/THI5-like protein [Clostridium beijerinckii ATCC 35702]MBF7811132.1 ABC transporter substrate-binding protein [Clostridium beijerinckii]NOW91871.1 putative hydroxymethylpyrimidine transport system substrate-binding protein [Clostridium beijerinckii]NRT24433.1 putative hydroxymethylpyrimidine transport system substrate-binding protein [Clo
MKLKKLSIFLLFIMLVSLVFSGCSSASNNKEDKSATKELKEINVLLDWYPNAVHSFLYAAEEQGYFKEAGLKVNLITPAGTDDGIKLVAAGKADLAISYPKQIILARGENIPIKSVGAIVRSSLNQLMVRKDSGVKTLKDLEGKKVGYASFDIDKETVKAMVAQAGGDPSKVEFVDVGYDLMPGIETKQVDAIIGGYINHEKILLEKKGIELETFAPSDFGVPNNYELAFVASDDAIKNNNDTIQAFLGAAKKGFEYTQKNPDKALDLILKAQNESFPLDEETEKKSLEILLPLMENESGKFLSQDKENWNNNIKWLKDKNLLQADVDSKDVFQ